MFMLELLMFHLKPSNFWLNWCSSEAEELQKKKKKKKMKERKKPLQSLYNTQSHKENVTSIQKKTIQLELRLSVTPDTTSEDLTAA